MPLHEIVIESSVLFVENEFNTFETFQNELHCGYFWGFWQTWYDIKSFSPLLVKYLIYDMCCFFFKWWLFAGIVIYANPVIEIVGSSIFIIDRISSSPFFRRLLSSHIVVLKFFNVFFMRLFQLMKVNSAEFFLMRQQLREL